MALDIVTDKEFFTNFANEMWNSQQVGELNEYVIENRSEVLGKFLNDDPELMGLLIEIANLGDRDKYNELVEDIGNGELEGIVGKYTIPFIDPVEKLKEELRMEKEKNHKMTIDVELLTDVVVMMMDEKFS